MKNSYISKCIRTITAVLPVKKGRKGSCKQCGRCCKLPKSCVFLDYNKENKAICKIYKFRPLNCRKYPRTAIEHITKEVCSYYFRND